jgi:hypothetical protein
MANFEQIRKYVGDLSQVAGIRHMEFKSGRAKGVESFEVRTGGGLEYTVLKDRCLDIAWVNYKDKSITHISNTGIVAPQYFEPEGLGFLRSFFVGLLTTCGVTYAGSPTTDDGKELGLHGRIANIPAEETGYETIEENGEIIFKIKGKVKEAMFFNENIVLEREITSKYGENKITIVDKIINKGFQTQPIQMLYHFNFGYPLLSEKADLLIPVKSVKPRTPRAAEGLDKHLVIEKPQHGFTEQVYFIDLKTDDKGDTMVALVNKELGFGFYEKFNKKVLPNFVQWKQMGEGYYVMGLEPGNCDPDGRDKAREKGTLEFIKPGETKEFKFELGILEDNKQVDEFKKTINNYK